LDAAGRPELGQQPTDPLGRTNIPTVTDDFSVMGLMWKALTGPSNAIGTLAYFVILVPMATVSMAFAAAFLIPAINILTLVQAVKSLSKTMGEEMDISVLTRMI
jgi:hypothetical protein